MAITNDDLKELFENFQFSVENSSLLLSAEKP